VTRISFLLQVQFWF